MCLCRFPSEQLGGAAPLRAPCGPPVCPLSGTPTEGTGKLSLLVPDLSMNISLEALNSEPQFTGSVKQSLPDLQPLSSSRM